MNNDRIMGYVRKACHDGRLVITLHHCTCGCDLYTPSRYTTPAIKAQNNPGLMMRWCRGCWSNSKAM